MIRLRLNIAIVLNFFWGGFLTPYYQGGIRQANQSIVWWWNLGWFFLQDSSYIKRGRDSVHIFSSSLSLYSFHTLKLFSAHTHTYYMYILHVHVHAGIALYTYTQAHRRRGLHCSVYIHTGTQEAWVEPTLLWGYTQAPHKHYGMGGSMKSLCALEPIKSVNPTTKWFLLTSVNTHVMYGQWQCIGQLLTWPCVWHVWRVLCVDCKCIVKNDVQGIMSMHHGQAKYGAALI